MLEEWIYANWSAIPFVLLSGIVTYAAILAYTRLAGLRSFSKMSAADFAMTVAVGSLFASTVATSNPSLLLGLVALATLYFGQWLLAFLRRRSLWLRHAVDNKPLLLMARGKMLEDNLEKANLTHEDVYGKLREANALNYSQVLAVVFETTGDISVMHSTDENARLEPDFFQHVAGADRLFEDGVRSS